MLLRCGCLQVGICGVYSQHCSSMQHGVGEHDLYTLVKYHTSILGVLKIRGDMTILHLSYFVSKVHLAREYYMS